MLGDFRAVPPVARVLPLFSLWYSQYKNKTLQALLYRNPKEGGESGRKEEGRGSRNSIHFWTKSTSKFTGHQKETIKKKASSKFFHEKMVLVLHHQEIIFLYMPVRLEESVLDLLPHSQQVPESPTNRKRHHAVHLLLHWFANTRSWKVLKGDNTNHSDWGSVSLTPIVSPKIDPGKSQKWRHQTSRSDWVLNRTVNCL